MIVHIQFALNQGFLDQLNNHQLSNKKLSHTWLITVIGSAVLSKALVCRILQPLKVRISKLDHSALSKFWIVVTILLH